MFTIRGRRSWGAVRPRSRTHQLAKTIHTLVIHHTAGDPTGRLPLVKRQLRAIQHDHMNRQGWSDIGYNYLIDRFGRVWEGRGRYTVGAHTARQNTGTIGVAFLGNYDKQRLNQRQVNALNALVKRLGEQGVEFDFVKGHRQMPGQATACPGKNVMKRLGL